MTAACAFCGHPVDPAAPGTWRRVIGWERKGIADSRRGGSDITLREPRDEWACSGCIALQQSGIPAGQGALW